jgi:hypothetical protein
MKKMYQRMIEADFESQVEASVVDSLVNNPNFVLVY